MPFRFGSSGAGRKPNQPSFLRKPAKGGTRKAYKKAWLKSQNKKKFGLF